MHTDARRTYGVACHADPIPVMYIVRTQPTYSMYNDRIVTVLGPRVWSFAFIVRRCQSSSSSKFIPKFTVRQENYENSAPIITSAEEGGYVFTSVCLSVRRITE